VTRLFPSGCAVLAILCAACGEAASTGASLGSLELFSWWTSASEREALDAVLAVHADAHGDVQIINAADSQADKARDRLVDRLSTGLPPDTFQANIGRDLFRWVLFNGADDRDSKVEPLDDLVSANDWNASLFDPVRDALSYRDKLYGVPLNVHRINSLFYNQRVFDDLEIEPPATLPELFEVLDELVAAGYERPLSIGNKYNWTMSLFTMENLFPAIAGPDFYLDYWTGREHAEHPLMQETLETLLELWPYFNESANEIDWTEGVERLFAPELDQASVMTVMGDWAKGHLIARGYRPGADFGQVPFPGSAGTFVFTSDSFPLPKGAPNRQGAIDLLTTFGSLDGQLAFNALKGSIPARKDVDPDDLDVLARVAFSDFKEDRVVVAVSGLVEPAIASAIADAVRETLMDEDADPVLFALRNYYSTFEPRP
jgi:glucose/mannose transport system substrate-binding protein